MNKKTINFLAYSGASALQPMLSLLLLPILARLLGPAQMGLIAYVDSTVLFVAVVSILGTHHYYYRSFHEVDRAPLLGSLQTFLIGYNGLILLALCFGVALLASDYSRESFLLAVVANFMNTVLVLPLRELRMQERAVSFGLVTTGIAVTQSLVGVGLIVAGWGAEGKYWGQVFVTTSVAVAFGIVRLRGILGRTDWQHVRRAVRLGIPLMVSGLSMMTIALSDRIVLKLHLSYAEVGVYSVGYTLGFSLSLLSQALYSTFEPRLYKHPMDTPDFRRELRQAWLVAVSLMTFISCAVIVCASPLVEFLLPDEFGGAAKIARIVSAATIFNAGIPLATLIGVKRQSQRFIALVAIAAAVLNVVLNVVLIPRYGSIVAALSTVAAYGLIVVLHLRLTRGIEGLDDVRIVALGAPVASATLAIFWAELGLWGYVGVLLLATTAAWNLRRLYSLRTAF